MHRTSWQDRVVKAAASKKERTKQLLARMKERRAAVEAPEPSIAFRRTGPDASLGPAVEADRDFGVIPNAPNRDLVQFIDLIDRVSTSERKLHAALFWPHVPPALYCPGCFAK